MIYNINYLKVLHWPKWFWHAYRNCQEFANNYLPVTSLTTYVYNNTSYVQWMVIRSKRLLLLLLRLSTALDYGFYTLILLNLFTANSSHVLFPRAVTRLPTSSVANFSLQPRVPTAQYIACLHTVILLSVVCPISITYVIYTCWGIIRTFKHHSLLNVRATTSFHFDHFEWVKKVLATGDELRSHLHLYANFSVHFLTLIPKVLHQFLFQKLSYHFCNFGQHLVTKNQVECGFLCCRINMWLDCVLDFGNENIQLICIVCRKFSNDAVFFWIWIVFCFMKSAWGESSICHDPSRKSKNVWQFLQIFDTSIVGAEVFVKNNDTKISKIL